MLIEKLKQRSKILIYPILESIFRSLEKSFLSRGEVIEKIPGYLNRTGGLGTTTFSEWCYTVGIFHSIIYTILPNERPFKALDVGCGAGRLYLSMRPHMSDADQYVGLDINPELIERCKKLYKDPNTSFHLHKETNAFYMENVEHENSPWEFEDKSFDIFTALSVWTHLREEDWRFYLKEVGRVLKPGGCAMISFFILDDEYEAVRGKKTGSISRYYPQPEDKWVFDSAAYGSTGWFCPSWARIPEIAIGVKNADFEHAVKDAGLSIEKIHTGAWKDKPSLFFQDIAILKRD